MKAFKLFLFFVAVANPLLAFATPKRVLIVRHAEKPSDEENFLSARGRARAEAIAALFTAEENERRLGSPELIFAAAPKHAHSSVRPYQTVAPLARALHLKVNLDYTKDETEELARDLLKAPEYDGKTILISWVHKEIPALAEALGATEVPAKWDGDTYDRIWKINFPRERAGDLIDLPQNALPGDSKR
ncbi:MAG: histidine phosphatase family protein [Proteobacteria bacterium]|nr:MAG: histidine phosphatase family protein [Pseudomonadota bacterium]